MDADDSRKPVVLTHRMAHDLMNHLTTALGHAELLAMELPADDPSRGSAEEIARACESAIRMVRGWMA